MLTSCIKMLQPPLNTHNATPDTSCCFGGVDRGGGGAVVGNANELNDLVLMMFRMMFVPSLVN